MVPLRRAFGRAVRRLRAAKGYSQERFANHCGINRTYMTAIETGNRNVSLDIIERIAKGLGMDTGSLFAEVEAERRRPKG